jgi:hypothetical protein
MKAQMSGDAVNPVLKKIAPALARYGLTLRGKGLLDSEVSAKEIQDQSAFENVILSVSLDDGVWPLPDDNGSAYSLFSAIWNIAESGDDFEVFAEELRRTPEACRVERWLPGVMAALSKIGNCFTLRLDRRDDPSAP